MIVIISEELNKIWWCTHCSQQNYFLQPDGRNNPPAQQWMSKQSVEHTYNAMLFSFVRKKILIFTAIWRKLEDKYSRWNKPNTKGQVFIPSQLHKVPRRVRFRETENGRAVTQAGGWGEGRVNGLLASSFTLVWGKRWIVVMVAWQCEWLNGTESFT